MATVTKKELIERLSRRTGQKRTASREMLQALMAEIIETLGDGDRIELREFGVFEIKVRKARMAQNPRTLERLPVPAKRSVRFKAGRLMQQAVDQADLPPETLGEVKIAQLVAAGEP